MKVLRYDFRRHNVRRLDVKPPCSSLQGHEQQRVQYEKQVAALEAQNKRLTDEMTHVKVSGNKCVCVGGGVVSHSGGSRTFFVLPVSVGISANRKGA